MALAVNRTGVILEKRDLSYHRPVSGKPVSVKRCATATYQSTCPANTTSKCRRLNPQLLAAIPVLSSVARLVN